jgi:hypothetical protein
VRIALVALVLVACSSTADSTRPSNREHDVRDSSFSSPVSGLAIALEIPPSARAGDSQTARLHLRNTTTVPLRVYFLEPDVFRSFQSNLLVRDASGKVVGASEPSPPHGYLPRESDFPLLAPGETKTFTQSLPLDASGLAAGGRFDVEWTYSNSVTEWKGGAQTLDGPTQPLFGGGPIPHIWTGRVSISAPIALEPRR